MESQANAGRDRPDTPPGIDPGDLGIDTLYAASADLAERCGRLEDAGRTADLAACEGAYRAVCDEMDRRPEHHRAVALTAARMAARGAGRGRR